MMAHKTPLALMGLGTVRDLGVLDRTPPPLSFENDLNLSPPAPPRPAPTYSTSKNLDFSSYFEPGAFR